MNPIPEQGYLRLSQIVGNRKANPVIPPIVPISKASWWRGVKSGRYPKPIKLTKRTTVWRANEILAFLKYGLDWKIMLEQETQKGG